LDQQDLTANITQKKLKETLSFSVIETGALLRKEIIKKSDLAGDISQAFLENRYVDD